MRPRSPRRPHSLKRRRRAQRLQNHVVQSVAAVSGRVKIVELDYAGIPCGSEGSTELLPIQCGALSAIGKTAGACPVNLQANGAYRSKIASGFEGIPYPKRQAIGHACDSRNGLSDAHRTRGNTRSREVEPLMAIFGVGNDSMIDVCPTHHSYRVRCAPNHTPTGDACAARVKVLKSSRR